MKQHVVCNPTLTVLRERVQSLWNMFVSLPGQTVSHTKDVSFIHCAIRLQTGCDLPVRV